MAEVDKAEKAMKVVIPAGHGVDIKLSRSAEGKSESKTVRVQRGALCSDWFVPAVNDSGHLALEPDRSPVLSGLAPAAAAAGWAYVGHSDHKPAGGPGKAVTKARKQGEAKGLPKPTVTSTVGVK